MEQDLEGYGYGIVTSVRISADFHKLAKEHNINFTEAMRKGLALTFAEMGIRDYDNSLNIMRRMEKMSRLLEASIQEAEALRAKANNLIV